MNGQTIPEVVYTVYEHNKDTGAFRPTKAPTQGMQFVDGIATGCLLIKRELLESMKAPYFEFSYHPHTRDLTEGEDLNFARKVFNMGHRFLVDFGTLCRHTKSVDLLDVNNYAISYANRAIMGYDAQIKAQIQPALDSAYKRGYDAALAESKKSKIIIPNAGPIAWPKV